MSIRPTSSTDDLEDRLRATLRQRADAITSQGPGLQPTTNVANLRTPASAGAGTAIDRPHSRLATIAAVAASIVAIGALMVAVRSTHRTPERVRSTRAPATATMLPPSFDAASAQVIYRAEDAADAPSAARSYVSWRLSDLGSDQAQISADLHLRAGRAVGGVTTVAWRRSPSRQTMGAVLVRHGKAGFDVIAATTPGVDLTGVEASDTVIGGSVHVSSTVLPGKALVDVWEMGHAAPTFGLPGRRKPTGPLHYGASARGDDPLAVDTRGSGAVVAVRFMRGSAIVAISEVFVPAPGPEPFDPTTATEQERADHLRQLAPDPRCTAAERANRANLRYTFPGGDGSAPTFPVDGDPFAPVPAPTPAQAVATIANRFGVRLRAATLIALGPAGPTFVGTSVTDFGAFPEVSVARADDGTWITGDVTTPAACFSLGSGNLTPQGAAQPHTRLSLATVAGASSGRAWYRIEGVGVRTLALDADDFARGNVAVDAEYGTIDRIAVVGRDRSGAAILVQVGSTG